MANKGDNRVTGHEYEKRSSEIWICRRCTLIKAKCSNSPSGYIFCIPDKGTYKFGWDYLRGMRFGGLDFELTCAEVIIKGIIE